MPDPMASVDAAKQKLMRDMRAAMTQACDQSATILLDEMKALAARTDHDLKQLAEMGHPYGWGKGREPGDPHPDWIVHLQSGELYGGLKKTPAEVSHLKIRAEIHSEARHTWYVLLGTEKMRPRDFVSAALITREREVQRLFENALAIGLGEPSTTTTGDPALVTLLPRDEFPAQLPGGR